MQQTAAGRGPRRSLELLPDFLFPDMFPQGFIALAWTVPVPRVCNRSAPIRCTHPQSVRARTPIICPAQLTSKGSPLRPTVAPTHMAVASTTCAAGRTETISMQVKHFTPHAHTYVKLPPFQTEARSMAERPKTLAHTGVWAPAMRGPRRCGPPVAGDELGVVGKPSFRAFQRRRARRHGPPLAGPDG